jgi:hypothetical protein
MHIRILRSFLLFLVFLVSSIPLFSKNQPASDPQAVSFAAQAIAALTNGLTVSDVTLTGSVTWTLGSETDGGTGTLMALGTGESRMDLALSAGTRTEIRDSSTGTPLGKWVSQSGGSGMYAFHNCWTDGAWFFPALGSLGAGPNVVLSYIGLEKHNGAAVQHLQSYFYQANQLGAVGPQQWSVMDFYLDSSTLLPLAIAFTVHPDDNINTNIPMEIRFDNYQLTSGVRVPFHIQRFFNGNLVVDAAVTSVSINTGLSSSLFAVQ